MWHDPFFFLSFFFLFSFGLIVQVQCFKENSVLHNLWSLEPTLVFSFELYFLQRLISKFPTILSVILDFSLPASFRKFKPFPSYCRQPPGSPGLWQVQLFVAQQERHKVSPVHRETLLVRLRSRRHSGLFHWAAWLHWDGKVFAWHVQGQGKSHLMTRRGHCERWPNLHLTSAIGSVCRRWSSLKATYTLRKKIMWTKQRKVSSWWAPAGWGSNLRQKSQWANCGSSQILFICFKHRWFSSKMEWVKVWPMKISLKACTSQQSPFTRAARFLLILAHILNILQRTSSTNRWVWRLLFPLLPLDVAISQLASLWALIYYLCSFLRPIPDEWHGLGSRDRTHTGRHAVPCGDGRGWTKQPSVGRVESRVKLANPLRLTESLCLCQYNTICCSQLQFDLCLLSCCRKPKLSKPVSDVTTRFGSR